LVDFNCIGFYISRASKLIYGFFGFEILYYFLQFLEIEANLMAFYK